MSSAYLQVLIEQPQLPELEGVVLLDEELLLRLAGGLVLAVWQGLQTPSDCHNPATSS